MPRLALVVAAALAAAPLAARPEAPAANSGSTHDAAAPSPRALELAHLMLSPANWRAAMDKGADIAMEIITSNAGGRYSLAPEFRDRLREEYERLMPYEEMVQFQAALLAKQYTEAELGELVAFYRTPLGQKSVARIPEVMQESMAWANARVQAKAPEMMEHLTPYFRPAGEAEPSEREVRDRTAPPGKKVR